MDGARRLTTMALRHHRPDVKSGMMGRSPFGDHGLLGIETEAIKMLMIAALNLVECIAETAPAAPKTARQ
jgi:hypothetical protein